MLLVSYLKKQKISQAEFAALVGVSQSFVSQVIAGTYVPRGRKAIDWASATHWEVTPHELNPDDYPYPKDGLPDERAA
ncbi:hypothetical protein YP72344_26270 [Yersinia pseudotuberculosis]|uniref:helix-turn-helix domain-containing protein n=1 Tax=Yersinia pseudotuberculosis TaxID=633 RepID=UPI002573A31B|nr:helix-turn-helix transcriptional regulator [Yersinia pseudotuberculosis]BCU91132.1 hypothetical protein YP72344_26270 [Yersinia pseudotuberculosis]